MPNNVVKTPEQEALWEKAKAAAEKQGQKDNYAYIMSIYKTMGGLEKSSTALLIDGLFEKFAEPDDSLPSGVFYHASPVQGIKKFRFGEDTSGNNKGKVIFVSKDPSFCSAFGVRWNDTNARLVVETTDKQPPTNANYKGTVLKVTDAVDLSKPCSMYKLKGRCKPLRYADDVEAYTNELPEILSEEQFNSFRDMAKFYGLEIKEITPGSVFRQLKDRKTSNFEKAAGVVDGVKRYGDLVTGKALDRARGDFIEAGNKYQKYAPKVMRSQERFIDYGNKYSDALEKMILAQTRGFKITGTPSEIKAATKIPIKNKKLSDISEKRHEESERLYRNFQDISDKLDSETRKTGIAQVGTAGAATAGIVGGSALSVKHNIDQYTGKNKKASELIDTFLEKQAGIGSSVKRYGDLVTGRAARTASQKKDFAVNKMDSEFNKITRSQELHDRDTFNAEFDYTKPVDYFDRLNRRYERRQNVIDQRQKKIHDAGQRAILAMRHADEEAAATKKVQKITAGVAGTAAAGVGGAVVKTQHQKSANIIEAYLEKEAAVIGNLLGRNISRAERNLSTADTALKAKEKTLAELTRKKGIFKKRDVPMYSPSQVKKMTVQERQAVNAAKYEKNKQIGKTFNTRVGAVGLAGAGAGLNYTQKKNQKALEDVQPNYNVNYEPDNYRYISASDLIDTLMEKQAETVEVLYRKKLNASLLSKRFGNNPIIEMVEVKKKAPASLNALVADGGMYEPIGKIRSRMHSMRRAVDDAANAMKAAPEDVSNMALMGGMTGAIAGTCAGAVKEKSASEVIDGLLEKSAESVLPDLAKLEEYIKDEIHDAWKYEAAALHFSKKSASLATMFRDMSNDEFMHLGTMNRLYQEQSGKNFVDLTNDLYGLLKKFKLEDTSISNEKRFLIDSMKDEMETYFRYRDYDNAELQKASLDELKHWKNLSGLAASMEIEIPGNLNPSQELSVVKTAALNFGVGSGLNRLKEIATLARARKAQAGLRYTKGKGTAPDLSADGFSPNREFLENLKLNRETGKKIQDERERLRMEFNDTNRSNVGRPDNLQPWMIYGTRQGRIKSNNIAAEARSTGKDINQTKMNYDRMQADTNAVIKKDEDILRNYRDNEIAKSLAMYGGIGMGGKAVYDIHQARKERQ